MFYKELIETTAKYPVDKWNQKPTDLSLSFYKRILKPCSEIVNVYKNTNGKFLLRGVNNPPKIDPPEEMDDFGKYSLVFRSNIRKDRRTIQMSKKAHELYHKAFHEAGLTATRRNSIFTSSDYNFAEPWGRVYIIFPYNGFQYTWFEKVKNDYPYHKLRFFYNSFFNSSRNYDIMISNNPLAQDKKYQIEFIEKAKDFIINDLGGKNTDLESAINQNQEVLITGTKFVAFSIDLEKSLNKVIKLI